MAKTSNHPTNKFEQALRMIKENAPFFEIEAVVKSGLNDLKASMNDKAATSEEEAAPSTDS